MTDDGDTGHGGGGCSDVSRNEMPVINHVSPQSLYLTVARSGLDGRTATHLAGVARNAQCGNGALTTTTAAVDDDRVLLGKKSLNCSSHRSPGIWEELRGFFLLCT